MKPDVPGVALSKLIGSRIENLRALTYSSQDNSVSELQQLQLITTTGLSLIFNSAADGESLVIKLGAIDSRSALAIPDVGSSTIHYVDFGDTTSLLGRLVVRVATYTIFGEMLIGCQLIFDDGRFMQIFNAGDQLAVSLNREHPLAADRLVSRIEHKQ